MSQETREYLKQRHGMSNWGSPGFDLAREDRLEAAAEYLDRLFNDFSDYLLDGAAEATTADDVEWDDVPVQADPAPDQPRLKVQWVQIDRTDPAASGALTRTWLHGDWRSVDAFVQDESVGVTTVGFDGEVRVISYPRATTTISWSQVPA
jgi:hypothetical protein